MRFYADTSWWLGYKCRGDTQHQAALSLFEREPDAEVLWTPWQRVEVIKWLLPSRTCRFTSQGRISPGNPSPGARNKRWLLAPCRVRLDGRGAYSRRT